MCGRYSLVTDANDIQNYFQLELLEDIVPRYNIAPSQQVLTIISESGRRIGKQMRWGLVPYWANDAKIGYKLINARAESIDEKPSFSPAFKQRRGLIIADGFYEWQKKVDGTKQPYRFHLKDMRPFAMAGLFEWNDKASLAPILSCTIITTKPNDLTKEVHDRMPVIVPKDQYDLWLDPMMNDMDFLKSLLLPYPAEEMAKYPVSTLVNSPKNDHIDVLARLNSL